MAENHEAKWIDIDDIKIDDMQSRHGHWRGDDYDEELVHSMKGVGQIQDVIVRPVGAAHKNYKYGLVAGSRRFHAMVKAGKQKIRCIVRDLDDREAIKTSISENLGRKDLSPYEKTIAYESYCQIIMKEENVNKTNAEKIMAKELYNNEERYRDIQAILRRKERLPSEALLLIKRPEERTKEEKQLLEKYDIPLDFEAQRGVMRSLVSLCGSGQLKKMDDKEKADKLLSMIRDLELQDFTDEDAAIIIRDLRDRVAEGNPFSIALKKTREKKDEFETQRRFQLPQFYLPNEKYWNWHGKAIESYRKKPKDLVQKVYMNWLEKQAKEKGWT